jgi:DNA-directed RNA polymerase specialized sigma24 family protein
VTSIPLAGGVTEAELQRFEEFFESTEPRLRGAFVAAYGLERGREATAAAFEWAWEHRDRLGSLERPLAYLYRVGQSRSRARKRRVLFEGPEWPEPWFEPELASALCSLTERQRVAVVLVHGYSWTLAEVADLLGLKVTTVQNHLERGLARLRSRFEVNLDA